MNSVKGSYAVNLEDKDTSKDRFKRIFLEQLEYSPYLNEIKQLNRADPLIQHLIPRNADDMWWWNCKRVANYSSETK